jgi:hypothetical protein
MPGNNDKSQDRPPVAPKKPRPAQTTQTAAKEAARQERLAEALRANLRRRKEGGSISSQDTSEKQE